MQSAHLLAPSRLRTATVLTAAAAAAAAAGCGDAPSSSFVKLQNVSVCRTLEAVPIRRRRRSRAFQKGLRAQNSEVLLLVLGFRRRNSSGSRLDHYIGPGRSGRGAATVRMALAVEEEVAIPPSWERLAEKLGDWELGRPGRIAQVMERVFPPGDQGPVMFYRDSWSWCPYCERVWLQLEEKQISYNAQKIDMSCYGEKPEWYTSMVPSGLTPAVKLDGELVTDSMEILKRIEEKFPGKTPLLPKPEAPEFAALDEFLALERELVNAWINRLISSDGDDGSFESAMDRVNSALLRFSSGPYFLGSEFSLIDVVYAPFLERIAASMPYWLGVEVCGADQWPALNAWFNAMDSRPSYQAIKSDDYGIAHNLEFQVGSIDVSEAGAFYRALIDGTYGSWDLPLKPETTAWGTDDGTGKEGAKEEAAQFLIDNHEENVELALKGVFDGDKYRGEVDIGFRLVAQALMIGCENVYVPRYLSKEVGIAATYFRDRVSVPRDLSYPAARQIRAHLQWLAKNSGSGMEIKLASSLKEGSGLNSWLYPSKDELPDEVEMTIWDHLEELRDRLVVSVAAVAAAILGCFFISKDLIKILEAPVYAQGVRFLQLSPGEFFFTTLKVSGYCGLLIGSPVILYEIIAFVLPGLTLSERRFLGPIVLGSSVLFYSGVVFSYIVLTPAALNFFVDYADGAVESFWSIDQYFEFVLVLLFSTGISFQVPVIQLLLGQTRLVTGDQMLSVWKYVVVGSVAAAAVLTPSTDPLTQMLLAFPLMGLYLGGAFAVKAIVPAPKPDAKS